MTSDYFDISPEISEMSAVFPGDRPFKRETSLHFQSGANLVLSSIESTLHIGAHTDAPLHYHPQGQAIHERALNYYYGPCQVIGVDLPRGKRILPKDIETTKILAPRVLFKTRSFPNSNQWNEDFNSLSLELVQELAWKNVILVGIDTPSIDPAASKPLEAHQAVFKANMGVLEGIILKDVPDGVYTLIALPLKIKGADASPVRAVLWKK